MKRSIVAALSLGLSLLAACGQGIVASGQPLGQPSSSGGDSAQNAPPQSGPTLAPPGDAGTPPQAAVDAGPAPGMISGRLLQAAGGPLASATVELKPGGQLAQVDSQGDYLFQSVTPGAFELDFSAPGFQPATLTGTLAAGEAQTEPEVTLQRSTQLFATDGGIDWLAFAPVDGGLYAADSTTLWTVGFDYPAAPLAQGEGLSVLGFTSSGIPVAMHDCSPMTFQDGATGVTGSQCTVTFGDQTPKSAQLQNGSQNPPLIVGDAVLAPSAVQQVHYTASFLKTHFSWDGESESWQAVSESGDSTVVTGVAGAPAPVSTGAALVGYQLSAGANGGGNASPFVWSSTNGLETGAAGDVFALPPQPLAAAGGLAALAVMDEAGPNEFGLTTDLFGVSLVGDSMGQAFFMGELASAQNAGGRLAAVVPIAQGVFCAQVDQSSFVQLGNSATPVSSCSELFAGPAGSVAHLEGDELVISSENTGASRAKLAFPGQWATPVRSPGGTQAVFPGIPTLYDLAGGQAITLPMTPAQAAFSPDGSRLLLVGADGSLHAVALAGTSLADAPLEGKVSVATWTPDGKSVVYAGSDPAGHTGVFAQTVPSP